VSPDTCLQLFFGRVIWRQKLRRHAPRCERAPDSDAAENANDEKRVRKPDTNGQRIMDAAKIIEDGVGRLCGKR